MVGSVADDSPACDCCTFLAQVIVLSLPRGGEIGSGCILCVECHTAQVPCLFEKLLSRTDRRTGQILEMEPATLRAGDAAVVRLRPQAPMCVEPFSEYPPLGRFAVRDSKTTVAVGVVQEVEHAQRPSWNTASKAAKPSALRRIPGMGHSGSKNPTSRRSPPGSHCGKSTRGFEEDSGEARALRRSPGGSASGPKAPALRRNAANGYNQKHPHTSLEEDSGDDCIVGPRGHSHDPGYVAPVAKPSPFATFAVTAPSPFVAFGAATKKKVPERPLGRAFRADSTDGEGCMADVPSD